MARRGEQMSIFEHVEAVVVTTLVAALVWLWAEGKDVGQYDNQIVPVQLVAPAGMEDELVIEPAGVIETRASFETSSAQYDQFVHEIGEGPVLVTVPPPGDATTRVEPMNLQSELEHLVFGPMHIDLDDLDPAAVEVRVDRMIELPYDVALQYPSDASLSQPPSVRPAQAQVRLPASLSDRAGAVSFRVRLTPAMLEPARPGEPMTVTVPLELPEALRSPRTLLLTRSIDVTFTLAKRTATTTIDRLPVEVRQLGLALRRFNVMLADDQLFVRDIELSGSASAIEAIRSGQAVVKAGIRPTLDDLERGVTSLPVEFEPPPGVEVVSPIPQVSFTVTPRVTDAP
jgi:hypothetical protein